MKHIIHSFTSNFKGLLTKPQEIILASTFVLVLCLPLFGMFFVDSGLIALQENRRPTPFPSLSLVRSDLQEFRKQFDLYFNDHFALRDQAVALSHYLTNQFFKTTTSDDVLLGKNGWLFYRGNSSIENYRNLTPFKPEELDAWKAFFTEARDHAKSIGADFYVIIPPDSDTIYGDRELPDWVKKAGNESRLDQIFEMLKKEGVEFVDVRETLRKARDPIPLYWKTDTHWNDLGAYLSYVALMNKLHEKHPSLSPKPFDQYKMTMEEFKTGDLGKMLGMSQYYSDTTPRLSWQRPTLSEMKINLPARFGMETVTCDRCGTETLYMARDSFSYFLQDFMRDQFKEGYFNHDFNFDWELLRQKKPKIIVYEMVERYFMISMDKKNINWEK